MVWLAAEVTHNATFNLTDANGFAQTRSLLKNLRADHRRAEGVSSTVILNGWSDSLLRRGQGA